MRAPDNAMVGRRAWLMDVSKATNPDAAACIRQWLVSGPFHPFWSFWVVSCIHLRGVPGQSKPPAIVTPGASHEFIILSLESPPGCPVHPDPDDLETIRFLEPPDFVQQQIGLTDEQASEVCDLMVRAIVTHGYSPDSDYRADWEERVGLTAEHARLGGHPSA